MTWRTGNFAQDLLKVAGDEDIIAVSVSPNRRSVWDDEGPDHPLGTDPVTWEDALPHLSYKYDSGFGGQECHNVWAWTDTRVLFIHEYDGSTHVLSVPRGPVEARGLTVENP